MQAIAVVGTALKGLGAAGIISGVSAGLGVVGAIAEGQAQRASLSFQESIAKRNALIEADNAAATRRAGAVEAAQRDMEAASILGAEFARQAGSGFNILSPSLQRRLLRGRQGAAQDRLRVVQDAERQARSSENSATSFRMEASQARSARSNVGLRTALGVADSAIGGARMYMDFSNRRLTNSARSID